MSPSVRPLSLRLLAVLAVTAVVVLGTSQFASAKTTRGTDQGTVATQANTVVAPAAAPAGCGSGNLCFWKDINWVGGPGQLAGSNSSWFAFAHAGCNNGTWADCASSIYNNGVNCTAHVYYFVDFGAPRLDIARGTGFSNLTALATGLGTTWNDNIESNNWC